MAGGPSMYTFLRYKDGPGAIRFLKEAFGFEEKLVIPNEDGTIAHAELRHGDSVVMVGSTRTSDPQLHSPADVGGPTAGVYVVVDDPDAVYERAKRSGAEIKFEPTDQDYGSREFVALDPEGNIWNFGTYDPFAPP